MENMLNMHIVTVWKGGDSGSFWMFIHVMMLEVGRMALSVSLQDLSEDPALLTLHVACSKRTWNEGP